MIPGMNPKLMKQAMKKLGIKQEEIEAEEVIIKCSDKEIVIRNPSVSKVNAMGQETFQIVGDIEERKKELFSEEDVETIMEQTNCTAKEAKEALSKEKDLVKAILSLKRQ